MSMINYYTSRRDIIVGLLLAGIVSFIFAFSHNEDFKELHEAHIKQDPIPFIGGDGPNRVALGNLQDVELNK